MADTKADKPAAQSLRKQFTSQLGQLEQERSGFMKLWKDLAQNFSPWRSRNLFDSGQPNQGNRRNLNIIDNSPVFAARTLASGMMAGYTSPARPWMRLTTPDPGLMEYGPVRDWLYIVERRILDIFAKSNLYNVLPLVYRELGVFGTIPTLVLEDPHRVIKLQLFTAGSYYLANSSEDKVDTLYRKYKMTVRQMVSKFGLERCSTTVQSMFQSHQLEKWIDVIHVIKPRDDRQADAPGRRNMPFMSMYYDPADSSQFLLESGFNSNPLLGTRWDVTGEDVYGTSPGMDALGDARALQHQQKQKAKAIDKHVDPPMWGAPDLMNKFKSLLPGDVTISAPVGGGNPGFKPVYEIRPETGSLLDDINDIRKRVSKAFYEDLFLMLAQTDRREITAREIDERHEEKLLALGPVLERLNTELLGPLIDRTFDIMIRRSQPIWEGRIYGEPLIPPPPEELGDVALKVDYISILAQAQRSVATVGIERFVNVVRAVTELDRNAVDKLDSDQVLDEYAQAQGVPPRIVRSDEQVAEIRKSRQQQEQMQNMAAMAQPARDAAQAAKTVSEIQVANPAPVQ